MWELLILFFLTREHKSKCAAVGMQSWFEQNHLLSNCNCFFPPIFKTIWIKSALWQVEQC